MNVIRKYWNMIFGEDLIGISCFVLAEKSNKRFMLPGIYCPVLEDALIVSYTWIDGSSHQFIAMQDSYLFEYDKKIVFRHFPGDIFVNGIKNSDINMTSDLYKKINDVNIACDLTSKLKEYSEPRDFPWKIIMLLAGIIIGIIILFNTGVIPSLINTIMNSLNVIDIQQLPDIQLPIEVK